MAGSISARKNSLYHPQIIVLGLGVMCMWTCMFINAPTTLEKILLWGIVIFLMLLRAKSRRFERNIKIFPPGKVLPTFYFNNSSGGKRHDIIGTH